MSDSTLTESSSKAKISILEDPKRKTTRTLKVECGRPEARPISGPAIPADSTFATSTSQLQLSLPHTPLESFNLGRVKTPQSLTMAGVCLYSLFHCSYLHYYVQY